MRNSIKFQWKRTRSDVLAQTLTASFVDNKRVCLPFNVWLVSIFLLRWYSRSKTVRFYLFSRTFWTQMHFPFGLLCISWRWHVHDHFVNIYRSAQQNQLDLLRRIRYQVILSRIDLGSFAEVKCWRTGTSMKKVFYRRLEEDWSVCSSLVSPIGHIWWFRDVCRWWIVSITHLLNATEKTWQNSIRWWASFSSMKRIVLVPWEGTHFWYQRFHFLAR